MFSIYPSLPNINPIRKINSNANINIGNYHNDIFEYNIEKSNI